MPKTPCGDCAPSSRWWESQARGRAEKQRKEDLLLSRHKGAVVETFAVSELMKQRMNEGRKPNLTFYRDDHGFEVDTIADWKHTFAIEIKSANVTEKKLSANTKKYLELRNEQGVRRAVLYLGDVTMNVNGTAYISWKDWGTFAGGQS